MADGPTSAGSTTPSPGRRARPARPRSGRRTALTILKGFVIAVCVALVAGVAVTAVAYNNTEIPDPNSDFQTNTTYVNFRDGTTRLGSFAVQNRQTITYDQMPQTIKDAVVSAENRGFWSDRGFSVTGIARSVWAILSGGELQGGSTITQQYVKVYYLSQERTLDRKFTELMLAVKLGRETPKEQILEGYLNTIYFGRGAYGIQAAAKSYYNKNAADLTVAESAVLASVLNNPGLFDPSAGDREANTARLLERYRYVLDGMVETGSLDAAEAGRLKQALPEFPNVPSIQRYQGPNGFLLNMVRAELLTRGFTEAQIDGGGLQVTSTFDAPSQAAAVAAAQKYEKEAAANFSGGTPSLHAAIASVDVGTGEVRALYGGPDFVANSRNWATTPREAASTFKAYALAAGLNDGFSLRSTFRGNTFTPPGDTTTVRNEFSEQYGTVDLNRATALSINTAFVDMTTQMEDGPNKVIAAAEAAGVPRLDNDSWYPGSRITLGTAQVSPLDNATGFSTFANGGTRVDRHLIKEVKDLNGAVLYTAEPGATRTIAEDVNRDVVSALQNVVEAGSGRNVQQLERPVAGKTGTSTGGENEEKVVSAWFVGTTTKVSTAVMFVAGEAGNEDLDAYKRPGDGTFFGGTYPALTWAEYMKVAVEGTPVEEFPPAANVNADRRPSRPPQTEQRSEEPREEESTTEAPEPSETESTETTEAPEPSETETSEAPEPSETETTEAPEPSETRATSRRPTREPTREQTSSEPTEEETSSGGGGGGNGNGNNEEQSGDADPDDGGASTGTSNGQDDGGSGTSGGGT